MNELAWDAALQRLGGNLLQSWRWGAFKERQGWFVIRLHGCVEAGRWQAQILFKRMGGFSLAYIPCGPTLAGDHAALFPRMMAEIDAACREMRAISLIMEPNQRLALDGAFKQHGFVRWLTPFQPRLTMSVPIHDDQTMLSRMHHKTRYNIRLAQRQGMAVERKPADERAIQEFHELHAETAARNGIALLPLDYFSDLLAAFGDQAELLFAVAGDRPAAGALMATFGDEAAYLFAGSSQRNRGQGAGAYLIFRSLQWARERGCDSVDLGSITSPGLRDFKSGFGGVVHAFPLAMERRYRPALAFGARRLMASKHW